MQIGRFNLIGNHASTTLLYRHKAGIYNDQIAIDWFIGLSFFKWHLHSQITTAGSFRLTVHSIGPLNFGTFVW